MVFSNWLSWMKSRTARAGRRGRFVVPDLGGGVLIGQVEQGDQPQDFRSLKDFGSLSLTDRLKGERRTGSGFSRRYSLNSRLSTLNSRLSEAEVLEDRALLAAFSVSGSTLQLDLAASETVAITSAGSTYAFALTGGTWSGTDGAAATGNGLATLTATAAALSEVKVDDSGASTSVTFNTSGANTYTSSVIVTLDDAAAGAITFNGASRFTGTAALSASTSKNIDVNSGAIVSVVNGDLTFSANQQASPTNAAGFSGLQMDGTITTSGSGDISLFGKGGISGGINIGIAMSGGTVSSTAIGAAAGTVTLVGMSRGSSISFAIEAKGNSTVSSVSGNISITGTNDSFGGNNAGVYFQSGSVVRSTGEGANAANISITGTGQTGFGTDINEGVTFRGTNSGIFTVDGDVTIVGTGRTTSTEGDGISIKSSAIVRSLGDGNISLTGTGSPSGPTASGVLVSSATLESLGTGAITITGTGTTASGITLTSGGVGNLGGAAPVKLIADSMSIDGSSNILASASGSVTIAPRTSGNSINLGGADAGGTLGLSAAELARVQTGYLTIGDINTTSIVASASITLPATTNVNLIASSISLSGNTISAGSVLQTVAGQSDILVQQPAFAGVSTLSSGAIRHLGRAVLGDSTELVFTVANPGFANLTGVGITITGVDKDDFSLTVSPGATVVPGGSTTFTVRFTPLVAGFKNAVLHIASNDPDESFFDINLSGIAADGFLSGIKTVGPTGDFSSIGAAIGAIQTSVRSGPIVLELQPTYVSTGESFPLIFRYLGTTATDTLTIRPQAGVTGLSISSADTTAATVDLNGAQFVTFDGRPGGVGAAKELTIENTSTSGVALRFINEASNNTLKFVTLRGVNTSATSGTVVFSTTTGANGNDNNTIDTCDIRDGASTPTNGIYSLGTTTTAAQANSGNTVTNCNVFNFCAATAVDAAGVRLDGGNTDWTITGNSFYQTASRAGVSANVRAIFINNTSGNNFTVTGNFIGGDSPGAAVTTQKWTTIGSTRAYLFQGIRLNVGTTTASSVQGNTIANMVWRSFSSGGALPGQWSGIYVSAGNVNIGTVTGNTIGSGTGTSSISVNSDTSGGTSFGIGSTSTGAVAIANNTIGSITVNATSTSNSGSLVGIQVTAGANTISNNLIGSTTTANSLNSATSSTSSTGQQVTGILSSSSTSASITGNTVANLNNNYASTGISGQIRGIFTFAGVNTITGNTVRNLSTTSQNTLTTVSPFNGQSVVGIADTSSVAGQTVSQNTVHSLANTAASANVSVTGIYFAAAASSGHVIARNFVHSLAVSSSSATSVLNGMLFANGIFTAQNNLVRVGLDAAGTSTAGASTVRGIYDNGTTTDRNFYHNSVYVGGTQTSGAANTFAFTTSATSARDFRNNIFVNARSNSGGTGKHYAVNYGGTTVNPTGLTASNNLFFVSGTGGVLGLYNSADATTLAAWQTATGQDANSLNTDPLFVLPTGTAATVDLHLQTTSPALGAGLALAAVTNDFDGDLRPLTTPDIGADEFGVSNAAPVFTSSATPSVPENTLDVVALTATDADLDTVTFSITGGADSDKFEIVEVSGSPVLKFKTANTPNFEQPGSAAGSNTFLVTVTANDGQGNTPSQNLTVTVTNTNEPPTIDSGAGSVNVPENSTAVTTISASDPDASTTLTYSLSGTDATKFDISHSGVITFQNATNFEVDPTSYTFDVTVSDGSLSDTETVNVTVTNVNEQPTIDSGAGSFNVPENSTAVTTILASDPDASTTLIYSLSGTNAGKFNISSSGVITFKNAPNFEEDATSYTFDVTASDGELSDTATVNVTVTNANDAPIIEVNGVSRQQGSPASGSTIAFVYDEDGGDGDITVTVTSANPSNGVTVSNIVNTNGLITADVVADSTATDASFTLQASDGSRISTTTLNVTVTANTPPTLGYEPRAFVNKTVLDGLSGDKVNAVVVAGNTIYVGTGSSSNDGGLSISTDGGATFVNRTTVDGLGANTVIDISVNGSTVVVAHRFTSVFGYSISTDGGATFTYIEGGSFFYSIAESNGTIYGGSNGVGLKITSDGGNSFVTRTTADGLGNGQVRDIFVTGNTIYAGTAGGLSISTDGGTTFVNRTTADGLGNNFVEGVFVVGNTVYAATFGGLSTSTDGGATFTNKTTADGLGDNWVHKVFAAGSSVYAATNAGLSISTDGGATFTNTTTADGLGNNIVNAVAASSGTVFAGTNSGFSFGGGLDPTDPTVTRGDSVTVNPSSGPVDNGTVANIEVHSAGTYTGMISVNPATGAVSLSDAGPVGTHTITIRATDNSGATTDATITLTVTNAAPVVADPILDQQATEDAAYSFTFAADTFADPGDSLTYTASGIPSWLSFDAATRTFSGTPTNDDVGSVEITVTAKDSSNAEVSDTFTLTVANTNDAPTLSIAIPDQSATEGTAFSFTFHAHTFSDVDVGDSLRYSNNGLPSWLSFSPSTRTFSGTPTSAHVGIVSIDVIATDSSNASVTETFDIAVIGTQIVSSGGIVTITDVGGPSNDAVGITIDGDNLVVTLEGVTTEIPLAGLTELIINGGSGNDTLDLDLSHGPLPFNIIFNGGNGGFDTLNVTGFDDSGEFTAYTANYSNRNDGNIQYRNGSTVLSTLTYTGLEPITIDGTPTEVIFNLPSTNDTDVRLLDIDGADGFMRLTGSTFETTDFSIAAATSITINANAGNDRVTIQSVDAGYSGQLIVNGGAGNDVLNAAGSTIATLLRGDAGNDTLTGSANDDTLTGGSGNDSLNGGTGNDTVAETAAQLKLINTQLTGNGNDKLTSIERAILTGTATSNVLDASAFTLGNVTLSGGDGNDTLLGSAFTGATDDDDFNDSLDGGAGNDVVRQTSSTNQTLSAGPTPGTTIATGAGSDLWTSIEGAHFIGSGNSATTLDASPFFGGVTLEGGAGHDTLIGGHGNNVLNGNAGNDSLTGGETADTLYGGAGHDRLDGRGGSDLLKGQAGNDTIRGGNGDDRIYGEAGLDLILGGLGQDLIDGGSESDVIDGEAGHDTITGGTGNDAIRGGDGDDQLNGNAGNDTLIGSSGADVLRGGTGSDRLSGGLGNDRFEANGARITLGGGDDTVVGSNNTINEVFVFDFDRLLV